MKFNRILPFISIFLFIGLTIFIIRIPNILWNETVSTTHPIDLRNYRYHFVMVVHDTEDSYWQQAKASAIEVSKTEQVALEYYGSRFSNIKELERFLEMAVLSSADGILISIPDQPEFRALINEATLKKIPVLSLSSSIEGDEQISYVGISTYDLGFKSGDALNKAINRHVKVALLINSNFSSISYKNYLKGFQSAIRRFPKISLEMVVNSKGESISAEEQTQQILKNHPEIEAIVCTNPNDTLGVAKVVVDLNQVSQVTIIGSGLTNEIANYIKRGVIWGVLAEDPRELGTQSISALVRLQNSQTFTENYNLPLILVGARNVEKVFNEFNQPLRGNK